MQSLMGRNGRRRGMLPNGLGLLAVLGLLTTQAALVHAQTGSTQTGNAQTSAWPLKPLRIVAPFPPGGPADVQGRAIGQKLSQQLGQPVIIDNRAGAGGVIGTETVVKASPDGYTLLFTTAGALAVAPAIAENMPYDPARDLLPVARALIMPEVLALHPSAGGGGLRSLQALIAYARANPRKLNYSTPGNATVPHLAAELFAQVAGIELVHVPYRGTGPAMQDLLAGHVQMMFVDVTVAQGPIRSGRLLGVVVGSPTRIGSVPEVPTSAEAGLPGLLVSNWTGLLAPAATPRELVLRLNQAMNRALQDAELNKRFVSEGAQIIPTTPEEFAQFIRAEAAKWGPVAKKAGMKWE